MSVKVHLPRDHYGLLPAVHEWCKDNISEETWNMQVWHRHQIYTFENSADAAMFMLRWGGKIRDE